MDKFYLNNIFIDAKRNQVCHGETCELVEPKAMALLCVFAQHPKKCSAKVFNQRGTIIFSNENQQTVWDRNKVFNLQGEQEWSFDDGEIVHAFNLEQQILVHVKTDNGKNHLVTLSTNLAERDKLALPPEADFVSSAYYD
ncbi:hypothetical protein AAEU28_13025 [Pseudoalteromonas sp. SS15]|uniref:hypothetical protein n=1 Tax=Pseudoalteromonas sp. SS15 TaxID=3139393 RepID=UPI003BA9B1FF